MTHHYWTVSEGLTMVVILRLTAQPQSTEDASLNGVHVIAEAKCLQDLHSSNVFDLHCPRAAPPRSFRQQDLTDIKPIFLHHEVDGTNFVVGHDWCHLA